jgi:hypothetical protein
VSQSKSLGIVISKPYFEALPPGVDQLALALLGASAGDLLGRDLRLDQVDLRGGSRWR